MKKFNLGSFTNEFTNSFNPAVFDFSPLEENQKTRLERRQIKKLVEKSRKVFFNQLKKLKNNGFCKKTIIFVKKRHQQVVLAWNESSLTKKILINSSIVLVLCPVCLGVFKIPLRQLPGGRYLHRTNRNLVLAYVQNRKLSKEERKIAALKMVTVLMTQAVIEKAYEYMGPSIPGYFIRGTFRHVARSYRYEYVATSISYEIGNLLPYRIPIVSDFISAAQEEEGRQTAIMLGMRQIFDLAKTTPNDVFGRRAIANEKELVLIQLLMGKWSTTP